MNIRRIVTFAFTLAVVCMIFGLTGCERAPQMVPDDTTTMPETMDYRDSYRCGCRIDRRTR